MKLVNSSLLFKYLSGGLFTALTEYAIFVALIFFSVSLLAANTISFVIALIVSFSINRNLVFTDQAGYKRSASKQLVFYSFLALFNLIISNLLITVLAIVVVPLLAKIISMGIIAGYNLAIYRLGIFKTVTQP